MLVNLMPIMYYLAISILLNAVIFVAFRAFTKWDIHVFQAVVVNYVVCAIMGAIFLRDAAFEIIWPLHETWQFIAVGLGFVFIGTFYILGLTTRNFGITIATISAKMSLIIPVLFGLFVFKTAARSFGIWNYLGIALALSAVVLTSIKKTGNKVSSTLHWSKRLLPLGLFFIAGALDTTLNYANYRYLNADSEGFFIWVVFITAALIGIIILLVQWQPLHSRSLWGGLFLGIPNFFSMYFIIKALSAFNNDGAVLFPLFNVGIIICSTLAAVTIFKEKLLSINKLGIILAVISVLMISYQELILWLN